MDLKAQLQSGETKQDLQNLGMQTSAGKASPKTAQAKPYTETPINKKPKKEINLAEIINWVIVFLVLLLLAYLGFVIYKTATYSPKVETSEIQLIDDQTVIDRIDGSTEQTNKTSESTGRSNPFDSF